MPTKGFEVIMHKAHSIPKDHVVNRACHHLQPWSSYDQRDLTSSWIVMTNDQRDWLTCWTTMTNDQRDSTTSCYNVH